jgi:catechol 2,3-dioxygenase-like lactoylglutathione lyase family enzyme
MANTARHVGVVVKDIAKAIDFWTNLIGFKLHVDAKEVSPYIDELLGMKIPELRTVKLIDENSFILELLEFRNYPGKDNWEGNLASTGLTHIALTVDNLDSLTSKLKQNNYEFVSNIMNSPNGIVSVVFVRGPEGLMLELVEELVKK